jgi:outer membrane protein TolC
MRTCKLILFSFLFIASAHAQDTSFLSLQEAIQITLKNNFQIRLAQNDSASAALDKSYSYTAFLPTLNGTASKVWNVNDQKIRLANGDKREGKGIHSSTLAASANLNWTLFDGKKMFVTRDRFNEIVKLGELTIKDQVVNTVANVINTYYNISRQMQQLKAIEEQMFINEERVKLAQRKFETGLGAKPELLQAKVDLNAQKAARLSQLTLIAQLKDQLNILMGIDGGDVYRVADSIPINKNITLEELQSKLDSGNTALLLARKNIDIANLQLKEAKADRFPVISFNSAYNFNRIDNKQVVNQFSPLFSQNAGLNYGFSASIPIFNRFMVKRNIGQAKINIQNFQLQYEMQKAVANIKLNNAFKSYELQKQLLQLEEENILLAKENVDIALERFRLGVSTYLELRETQKSLEDAYNRLIAARYNTKVAETELLRLKGDILK